MSIKAIKKLNKIDDKKMIIIMSVAFFIMLMNCIVPIRWLEKTGLDTVLEFVMCSIILLCNFNGNFFWDKHKRILAILIGVFGIIEIVVGIAFSVLGYVSYGAFYLIIPTILLCIISDIKQVENIMISMSIGVVASYLILFILSAVFTPLGTTQYEAFTGNPNSLGMFSSLGFCASMYLGLKSENFLKLFFIVVQGSSLSFIIFSRSRTSYLVVIAVVIVVILYATVNRNNDIKKKKVVEFIFKAVVLVAAMYVSYIAVTHVNSIIKFNEADELKKNIEMHFNVNILQQQKDIEQFDFDESLTAGARRGLKGLNNDDSFTSGRLAIWKNFASELSFHGHKVATIEVNGIKGYNAHNAYLQIAYSFGIGAGVVYFVITFYFAVKLLKSLYFSIKNRNQSPEECFAYIIFCGYFIYSMLSAAVSPFAYFFVMMINMGVVPLIGNVNGDMLEKR